MRGTALSLTMFGLALAAPAPSSSEPLEARQKGGVITIGNPGSGGSMTPTKPGDCNQLIWEQTGFCVILGDIKPTTTTAAKEKRGGGGDDVHFDLPDDKGSDLRDAIRRAQLELQELQAKKSKSRADKKRIEALEYFIKKTSGVIGISPPDGGSTVLIPGRRRGLVANEKRQSKSSPCLVDLEKYAKELQDFLLSFPPWERARIWAQLIQGVCGIQTGPIIPDPTTPGAPIKPDPVTSGAPMKPGKL